MNYHQARQLGPESENPGKWNWSTRNGDRIWTAAPCSRPDGSRDDHDTQEEAERHFYDHEANNLREVTYTTADRCQGPHDGEAPWTDKSLEARLLGHASLCDEHRNADGWRLINPFHPGIQITASW